MIIFSKWTRERQNSTDEWSYAVQIQKAYVQDIAHDHINLLFEGTQPKPNHIPQIMGHK